MVGVLASSNYRLDIADSLRRICLATIFEGQNFLFGVAFSSVMEQEAFLTHGCHILDITALFAIRHICQFSSISNLHEDYWLLKLERGLYTLAIRLCS